MATNKLNFERSQQDSNKQQYFFVLGGTSPFVLRETFVISDFQVFQTQIKGELFIKGEEEIVQKFRHFYERVMKKVYVYMY